ncbi:MAG: porin [Pseudomonadota bacterium]
MRVIWPLLVVFAAALPGPQASAQAAESAWIVTQDLDAALVLAPGGEAPEGAVFDRPRERALYEVSAGLRAERLLGNGWSLGGRGALRVAKDYPTRPAGTGNLVPASVQSPAGALSRLSRGPGLAEAGPRGSLESAYLFLETGYGEFSLGRDTGVAARFHEGDVSALSSARLASPFLDPSGLAGVHTRPDVTGPSSKFSYTSPRLLGVRAGVSLTPRADTRGLDRDATGRAAPPRPELDNAVEVAVNVSRRLRESGVRLRAGLSYARAELDPPGGLEGVYASAVDQVAAGGEVSWRGGLSLGANWLWADEGLTGGGDYTAWSAGLAYDLANWRASFTYGRAEADAAGAETEALSLAIARPLTDAATIAVAWQDREVSPMGLAASEAGLPTANSRGVVVEITLAFENCLVSQC